MAHSCCTDVQVEKQTWRGLRYGMPYRCEAFTPLLAGLISVLGPGSTSRSTLS